MSEQTPYTEARKKANKKWDEENSERITLFVPKGTKDLIRSSQSQSMNAYIYGLIKKDLGIE